MRAGSDFVLGLFFATAIWATVIAISSGSAAAIDALRQWQTLVAASVASFAAGLAFHNVTRSLRQSETQEQLRRRRKLVAIRAVLPLALAQITAYAQRTALALDRLIASCQVGTLFAGSVSADFIQPLPSEALKTLVQFIEYSTMDVQLVEKVVAWIQIHDSRLHYLAESNRDPARLVQQPQLVARIIDAACIYTASGAMFGYARHRDDRLPTTITWDEILTNVQFSMGVHDRGFQTEIDRRKDAGLIPFEEV